MTPKTAEAIEREREHLETLAESDLPAAWIAESILEAADGTQGGESA